jgi:hypothetical protein
MFLMGIITSIFGAVVITVILWVLCVFSGRLVTRNFRTTVFHHFVICFTAAIPTVILLTVFFSFGQAGKTITQAESGIVMALAADEQFTEQMRRTIEQTPSADVSEAAADYLIQKIAESISSKYPTVWRYVNRTGMMENTDIKMQLSGVLKGVGWTDAGKTRQLVQASVGFTSGIRSRINSVRRNVLIAAILLQVIAFASVLYRAGRYRKRISQL